MLDLRSPRRRRRLAWATALVLSFGGIVALLALGPDEDAAFDAPLVTAAVETEAAPSEAPLELTPALRRRVGDTVERFSETAVVRRRLDEGWDLASPTMRAGLTKARWQAGEIPVQPYPAEALQSVDWRVVERYPRTLLLDVLVQPKPGSGERVAVYSVELSAVGRGSSRRFLVDSWVPLTSLGGDLSPPVARGGGTRVEPNPLAFDDAKLGPVWFLVPAGIGAVLVLLLGGLVVRGVLVRRRAERRHREHFRT